MIDLVIIPLYTFMLLNRSGALHSLIIIILLIHMLLYFMSSI